MSNKGWSNVVGYGNINIAQVNPNNEFKVLNRTTPWNRIQPLSKPYVTPGNPKKAWSPPVSNEMYEFINTNCNVSKKNCFSPKFLPR